MVSKKKREIHQSKKHALHARHRGGTQGTAKDLEVADHHIGVAKSKALEICWCSSHSTRGRSSGIFTPHPIAYVSHVYIYIYQHAVTAIIFAIYTHRHHINAARKQVNEDKTVETWITIPEWQAESYMKYYCKGGETLTKTNKLSYIKNSRHPNHSM